MTAKEHILEAHRWLTRAEKEPRNTDGWAITPISLTKAHIHATLAVAAAMVEAGDRAEVEP